MGDLSPHFDRSEFRDRRTGELVGPPGSLVDALEHLRRTCGDKPLRIISAYRSPKTNAAVGGATRSRHLVGDAVDIPRGYATVEEAEHCGFTGIGEYSGWAVHVDLRPSPARWSYG